MHDQCLLSGQVTSKHLQRGMLKCLAETLVFKPALKTKKNHLLGRFKTVLTKIVLL